MGTDYPFPVASRYSVGDVDAAGLEEPERAAILGGTAARHLKRPLK
jgi:hypothetical protein